MFMRNTQFAPQVTYDDNLLGKWGGVARRAKLSRYEARLQFSEWLQRRYPNVADKARGFGAGMHGMGDDSLLPAWLMPPAPKPAPVPDYLLRSTVTKPKTRTAPQAAPVTASAPWWQSGVQNLFNYAPQAVAAASQYKIIKLNLERAERGLPPIDTAIAAPTVRVQTEVDPQTKQGLKYAGIGAAVLGGLLGLKLLKVI